MIYPQFVNYSLDFLYISILELNAEIGKFPFLHLFYLFEINIVARVRPRASKGITDLLLPHTSIHYF